MLRKHKLEQAEQDQFERALGKLAALCQLYLDNRPTADMRRVSKVLNKQVERLRDAVRELDNLNKRISAFAKDRPFGLAPKDGTSLSALADHFGELLGDPDAASLLGPRAAYTTQLARLIAEAIPTLNKVQDRLEAATDAARMPGGDPGYVTGRFLLVNLATLYADIGGRPTSHLEGEFANFVCAVLKAMELPTCWVKSQLRHTIKEWKQDVRAR